MPACFREKGKRTYSVLVRAVYRLRIIDLFLTTILNTGQAIIVLRTMRVLYWILHVTSPVVFSFASISKDWNGKRRFTSLFGVPG